MTTISSVTDIDIYVSNTNPGGVCREAALISALVKAIRCADGHPDWGRDWEEWLDENIDALVASAVASVAAKARQKFTDLCAAIGSDPIAEEQAILSVGRELLPLHARAVLDGGAASADYYEWLCAQTQEAQNEHDREYAAGHEWHRQ